MNTSKGKRSTEGQYDGVISIIGVLSHVIQSATDFRRVRGRLPHPIGIEGRILINAEIVLSS